MIRECPDGTITFCDNPKCRYMGLSEEFGKQGEEAKCPRCGTTELEFEP